MTGGTAEESGVSTTEAGSSKADKRHGHRSLLVQDIALFRRWAAVSIYLKYSSYGSLWIGVERDG